MNHLRSVGWGENQRDLSQGLRSNSELNDFARELFFEAAAPI